MEKASDIRHFLDYTVELEQSGKLTPKHHPQTENFAHNDTKEKFVSQKECFKWSEMQHGLSIMGTAGKTSDEKIFPDTVVDLDGNILDYNADWDFVNRRHRMGQKKLIGVLSVKLETFTQMAKEYDCEYVRIKTWKDIEGRLFDDIIIAGQPPSEGWAFQSKYLGHITKSLLANYIKNGGKK